MELPKSTVAGLVSTLEKNGYLEQNPENRKYRLGFKLAERAGVLLGQFDLRQVAAPVLAWLRDDCQESVNLAVRDGAYMVYIERMHGSNMLGMRSEIGKREKLHSTALGKALLAHMPGDERQNLIEGYEFLALTPHTITDRAAFTAELEETRRRGYAIDDQENELGGRCVAAAVSDYRGRAVAAISISVPLQRMPDERIDAFGRKIVGAAREISLKLGAPGDDRRNVNDPGSADDR
jgi:DNA-binding IclR family transcriptional regulator